MEMHMHDIIIRLDADIKLNYAHIYLATIMLKIMPA